MKSQDRSNNLFSQQGITLIELMVALTISSILMIGVVNIYSNSKRTYKLNDEYSILQENARLAFRFLTKDVRMAGYSGCAWASASSATAADNITSTLNAANLTADQQALIQGFGFSFGLEGYDANATGPNTTLNLETGAPAGFNRPVNALFTGHRDGSDILVVRHAGGGGVRMSGNKNAANFTVQDGGTNAIVDGCHAPSGICEDDILMVSDCTKGRIFQATNLTSIGGGEIRIVHAASGTPGNAPPGSWGGNAGDPATWYAPGDSEILKFDAYAYYIGTGASGQPALMRLSSSDAAPQELVEGVENMQILYGIDNSPVPPETLDGIPDQYFVAPVVATPNIVSVRISLLVSTPNEIPKRNDDTKTYKMLSENDAVNVRVTPTADRRIRKVFTTTIKLRNKGLVDE